MPELSLRPCAPQPSPPRRPPRHRAAGFTLAELAVVLVILGLLTGSMLVPLGARMEARDRQHTLDALHDIERALTGFAIIHGRLPCPSTEADPASPHYGLEDAAPCSMSGEGRLPWRSLGLTAHDAWGHPRRDASDDWSGHWRYRVDAAFVAAPVGAHTAPISNLQVRGNDGGAITTLSDSQAVAVVFSTGQNRRADGHNADYSASTPMYEAGEASADFDDLLIWIGRPLLIAHLAHAGRL